MGPVTDRKFWIGLSLIVLIILIIAGGWYLGNSPGKYSGPPESIAIGGPPLEISALIYIADDQGFFRENGLNVTIRNYDTGASAANGLGAGEIDLATASESVLATNVLTNRPFRTVATIDKYEGNFLIARKDRGIVKPSDLKGKKIGVVKGTTGEFYLGRFLELNGIPLTDVSIIDLKPAQMSDAITRGDVDAVLIWQPFANSIKTSLGPNAVLYPAQSGQVAFWQIIGRSTWLADHPALVDRFLSSLVRAEKFSTENPQTAKSIVQKRLQYDDAYITTVWPENQFSVSLDQSLILAMEDETRWMIQNNLTHAGTIPDFRNSIDMDSLDRIAPESVHIIH